MTDPEFFLALASAEKVKTTTEAALVINARNDVVAIGTGSAAGCETPIANVLHAAQGRLDQCWIAATYPPTALCLGMGGLLGIDAVAYLDIHRNVQDAAALQQIVKLRSIAKTAVDPFQTKPKTQIPDFKTAPDQYLSKLNTEFALLKETYQGAVKTFNAAGRFNSRALPPQLQTAFTTVPATPPPTTLSTEESDLIYMRLAYALVGQTWNPVINWDLKATSGESLGGNNVGVVFVHQNKIIGWGINVAAQNPIFHAESAGILAYLKGGNASLPNGTKVYTTLEPCKMCSGMIVAAGANIEAIYGAGDFAIKTILTDGSKPNGCSERKPKVDGFGFAETWIQGRKDEQRELARLGGDEGGGASTKFLRDDEDEKYRAALKMKAGLNPQQAKTYSALLTQMEEHNRSYPNKKSRPPFRRQKEYDSLKAQLDDLPKKRRALADNYKKGNMGNKYATYADSIVDEWKRLKGQPDSDQRRAYEQCIEVLKTVAVAGLTTNYGLNFVNAFFADFA